MTSFSRRGACPALSAPMQTGDGLLVRINPLAGELSSRTLIELAESAARHGNGIVEVTARGSIQIRGLTEDSACLLAGEVDTLGIAVRTGVPVDTSPLGGIDPAEVADPAPLAAAIRAGIEDAGLASRLGPKVSIVVDGRGQIGLAAIMGDVRLVAADATRWRISVGGDEAAATFIGEHDGVAACAVALDTLRAVATMGREGRGRDLGLPQSADESKPEPLPTTGSSPIGILPLADDRIVLGVGLPFGSIDAQTLIAFCTVATELGATGIRPAPGRTLLVMGLASASADTLTATATSLGLVTSPADARIRIAACPGAPACASGMIAARDVAADIAAELGESLDPTLSLHVSGCAKGCAHPGPATVTIVGDEKGAAFVVGGTAKGLPAAYTAGYEAARGMGRLTKLLAQERKPDEDAAACLARLGAKRLAQALAQE
ncbi:precorrin-3B synthase [Aminobacter sp. AP02]|uniref:precorrin-3B synthase n=1 Tax=Aminobacter sp. AP02 TaxID=2135737 RepID=UPI000D6B939B|nr:precorrin-3B synthase [Aminobacter sp. AP02]PWK69181.1 precorrin-3B synthase [Aminobacter sp. AP02]